MPTHNQIGFGGGCHWCTEAVFSVLKGVSAVSQGFVSSTGGACAFSEGVLLQFDPLIIHLRDLIRIHLTTHSSYSDHYMRHKYRSAIYTFSDTQTREAEALLRELKSQMNEKVVTEVMPFREFRASPPASQNYYAKDPQKPFCQKHIRPKLLALSIKFPEQVLKERMKR
jgi:peptide-methionine (S)-S-oxide reductase